MASRLVEWIFVLVCLRVIASQMYIDNGWDQTIVYRPLEVKEKQEMQQELLHLLGLNHRPKPKDHTIQRSAPQYLINLYKSLLDAENGDINLNASLGRDNLHAIDTSDVIISFINRIDHHAPHLRHDRDKRFWFDVSDVKPEEEIMAAELRLYRDLTKNLELSINNSYSMSLYLLTESDGPKEDGLQLIQNVTVQPDQDGWIVFNVTGAIVTWISFPKKNLGLYLQIRVAGSCENIDPDEIGIVGRKGANEKQPFMVAFLQTPRDVHVRRTRSARKRQKADYDDGGDDDDGSNDDDIAYTRNPKSWIRTKNKRRDIVDIYRKRSCQRLAFYVSFQQLNWQEWIIAPDGYAAFYCFGECSFPLNAHMNATNHAIVQTLVHLMDPKNYPKPCCAPTHLSSVQVLYLDDRSNVVLKKYRNMTVQSCGCH